MDNHFSLHEQVHNLTADGQYWVDVRSHYPRDSDLWSRIHRAVKEAARGLVFEIEAPKTKFVREQAPVAKIAFAELHRELKLAFPYRRFELSNDGALLNQAGALNSGWFGFTINLYGNTVAECEFALRSTKHTGENHAQRNDSAGDIKVVPTESARGIKLGGSEESSAVSEPGQESETNGDSTHDALLGGRSETDARDSEVPMYG